LLRSHNPESKLIVEPTANRKPLVLLRFSGDLSTKADGTKQRFIRRLARNVEDALDSTGIDHRMRRDRFRIYLEVDSPIALDVLTRVFGLQSYSPVKRVAWETLDDLVQAGISIFREPVAGKRFAVRARRGGDVAQIPFGSMDLERDLGTELLSHAAGVDLTHPEFTASIEVQPGEAYFYEQKVPARGGLPIGVEGSALSLVSGGFDSAVSSWLMLKRGVSLDYLFCNLGGDVHRDGVLQVMKVISDQWSYGSRPRLFELDFQPVVQELRERTEPKLWQVLLKRAMFRAGTKVAKYLRVPAIITGEAVGQVSSQTLQNLAVVSYDTNFAVLRPLLGFNKDEIIDLARDIGTYAFSAGVEEYCAILPRHPATHASLESVHREEEKLDPGLLDQLMKNRTVTELRGLELKSANSEIELDEIPADTTVIDLRSRSAYEAWHPTDALYLDLFQALKAYRSFDRDKTYVFYCEVGQKSAHLAGLMHAEGFRAFHVRKGVRTLMKQSQDLDALV
jgi:thiamine biosynthesis protein ThiI